MKATKSYKGFSPQALAALPGQSVILEYGGETELLAAGRLLAASRLCASDPPCLSCRHCTLAREGQHPDLRELDAADTKGQVERVRALRADAFIKPYETDARVFLLLHADKLSEASQNALLKIIEDPPPYALFVFLTESAEVLLPTVRSRSVLFSPEPPQSEAPDADTRTKAETLLRALNQPGGTAEELARRELAVCSEVMGWSRLSPKELAGLLHAVLGGLTDCLRRGEAREPERLAVIAETALELLEAQKTYTGAPVICAKLMAVCGVPPRA